jgi:hypothetical protein
MPLIAQLETNLPRYLLRRTNYQMARSLLSVAHLICKELEISESSILADVLFSVATLDAETNGKPSEIRGFALKHLELRTSLDNGTPKSQKLLSMGHCRLAQAYMLNGDYEEAVIQCNNCRSILSDKPEDSIWYQWSQIYEAWCRIAIADFEAAEGVILQQLQYQTENPPADISGTLMCVNRCCIPLSLWLC